MRILAYTLLITGFIWICFDQFVGVGAIERAVIMNYRDKIPKQQSYTFEDVQKDADDAVSFFARFIPSFYIGAVLMLGGGVVLDLAGRRKRVSQ